MAGPTYSSTRRLGNARSHEFSIVSNFKYGYRNREDVTNLPPGVLIVGSKNVLTNVSERVQIRQGYSVDGAAENTVGVGPVMASFDFNNKQNDEVHLRVGGMTSALNDAKMQYRYVDDAGVVSWRDLLTSLTTTNYNFTTFWRVDEGLRVVLFVNGTSNIFEWNGAVTTISSSTASTLTKEGTTTWLDAGFYNQTLATVGDATTQFDITNPAGTTFRYTYDTTGTNPSISAATFPIGSYVLIGAQNFNAANNGLFVVTNVGTNFFEVTNASGVVESNKTIGTGYIYDQFRNVLVIDGSTYGYTGGVATTTLTGVTPDASGIITGSIVNQAVITTANSAMTAITATFPNGLISTLNNQIFLGALTSSVMWLSNVNSYTDYSESSTRQTGEGGSLILDENLVAFHVQGAESTATMYVSTRDIWYRITFTTFVSVVGPSGETLGAVPIKTGSRQGAQSQAMVSGMKNNTIVVTNEPTIDEIGVIENYFTQIQTNNLSDPIKLDVDSYDFTDGSIAYWRYYILVAIPKEGIVRIYNLATNGWEAPQTLPISRFYIVDGELYGHSYTTFESYKLFTGYADRVYEGFEGFPIQADWVFSYQNYGTRYSYKNATKFYVEGYINSNTTLTAQVTYELDGCQSIKTFVLDGSDQQFVCVTGAEGSLGKESLGKIKLGGEMIDSIQGLPPKFRWFPTFTPQPFFEASISFSVLGTGERAEILAFGLAIMNATEMPVQNYQ